MFDDIDFLSPHSTTARPRRKPSPPPEVELIQPTVVREPRVWERLKGWVRKESHGTPPAHTAVKKAAPVPVSPSSPSSPVKYQRGGWWKLFHALPQPPPLPRTIARVVSPPSPPPPPPPAPPPPKPPSVLEPRPAPLAHPPQEASRPSLPIPHTSWLHAIKNAWHHQKEKGFSLASKEEKQPEMLEVNLLPEQEKAKAGYHARVMLMGAVGTFLVFAVLGASGVLYWRTNTRERELQLLAHNIADVEREMVQNASHLEQALAFQQRSRAVKGLFATHTHWSSFLRFIEEITSPDVYFEGFSGERNGTIKLKAHARDFNAAAEQLVTFMRDPRVTHVSISPLAAGDARAGNAAEVTFEITLLVDPKVIIPHLPTVPPLP